jgi:hypothetical protein
MEGIDTADDGFIQTKERSETGAFISLELESNQDKLERSFRAERYLESKGYEFY